MRVRVSGVRQELGLGLGFGLGLGLGLGFELARITPQGACKHAVVLLDLPVLTYITTCGLGLGSVVRVGAS